MGGHGGMGRDDRRGKRVKEVRRAHTHTHTHLVLSGFLL
jgi:hypothetical protein